MKECYEDEQFDDGYVAIVKFDAPILFANDDYVVSQLCEIADSAKKFAKLARLCLLLWTTGLIFWGMRLIYFLFKEINSIFLVC